MSVHWGKDFEGEDKKIFSPAYRHIDILLLYFAVWAEQNQQRALELCKHVLGQRAVVDTSLLGHRSTSNLKNAGFVAPLHLCEEAFRNLTPDRARAGLWFRPGPSLAQLPALADRADQNSSVDSDTHLSRVQPGPVQA